jgi:hypothetical protein
MSKIIAGLVALFAMSQIVTAGTRTDSAQGTVHDERSFVSIPGDPIESMANHTDGAIWTDALRQKSFSMESADKKVRFESTGTGRKLGTAVALPHVEAAPEAIVAASAPPAPLAAAKAQPGEERQITVRVRNYARIESGYLLEAETTARKILQEAGADVVWVVCFDGSTWSMELGCASRPSPMDLTVNVLPFSSSEGIRQKENVFGYATEDGEYGFAGDAWIFYDPIKKFAAEREMSPAQLLGHVLAHEMGHILLGAKSHSGMGLMRAQWSSRELQAVDQGTLYFSAYESKQIRKSVLARWQALAQRPEGSSVKNSQIRLDSEPR